MNRYLTRRLAHVLFVACSLLSTQTYAGWFSDNAIHFPETKITVPATPANSATIHLKGYSDARSGMPPQKIGDTTELVSGISGNELLLNHSVAEAVNTVIQQRFARNGYPLQDDGKALYELSGSIKELTYNVKARDQIAIAIETTLTETATGKIVWSGVVTEKDERFAGISGNSRSDIANYLKYKLDIVSKKTYDAINNELMATRPDLFKLTPGTRTIAGVTVLQATTDAAQPAATTPAVVAGPTSNGTLVLTTKPSRAKVYLDDIYFGLSPLHAEVQTGIHAITVKADKYKNASEKISIRPGETTELDMVLEH